MTLALSAAQCRALHQLRATHPALRFVLVGAAALGHHVPLPRSTADIDLAIAVSPNDLDAVLGACGWVRDPRALQRWRGPDGVVVDALPVSDALLAAGEVRFGDGDFVMSLVGFELAMRHTELVDLPASDARVEVASLAALVVLKIVAWLDRPYERTKDLGDLAHVLGHALAPNDARRWDPDHAVFQSGVEFDAQSAFFAGSEVARVIAAPHCDVLDRFFARIDAPDGTAFALMLRAARVQGDDGEERLLRQLAAFRVGLGR